MRCPACRKRKIVGGDTVCRTCRRFIDGYIATGRIIRQRVPAAADVLLVMRELGVTQDRAVLLLGGTP